MAGKNLNYAIVLRLITEGLRKGSATVVAEMRRMQMGVMSFAAALGAGTVGLSNLLSRMVDTAKETTRVNIALKNVSGTAAAYADNQKFLMRLAKTYGVEINALTEGFTKFKAAADISNMSMEDQRRIFESVSRAAVAFGMSAEDQKGVFLALSQMMSKNKVQAEELRLQMAERMPVAIQAMAKAAGVTVSELDNMMKAGKVIASDVLPKFADALNEMTPNVDTDNLNKSITDFRNAFTRMTSELNVGGMLKGVVDTGTRIVSAFADNVTAVFTAIGVFASGIVGKISTSIFGAFTSTADNAIGKAQAILDRASRAKEATARAQERVVAASAALEKAKAEETALAVDATEQQKRAAREKTAVANRRLIEATATLESRKEAQTRAEAQATAEVQRVAAMSTASTWKRAWIGMSAAARTAFTAIKSALISTGIGALLVGISVAVEKIISGISESVRRAREIRNLQADSAKRVNDLQDEQIAQMRELEYYSGLLSHNDRDVRAGALRKINELLGTQYEYADLYNKTGKENTTIQGEINEAVRKRIELIKLEAQAQNIANERARLREKRENVKGTPRYREEVEISVPVGASGRTNKWVAADSRYMGKRTGRVRTAPANQAAAEMQAIAEAEANVIRHEADVAEAMAQLMGGGTGGGSVSGGGGGGGYVDDLDMDALRKKIAEVFQEAFDYFMSNPRPAKRGLDVAVEDEENLPELWTMMPRDRSRDWRMSDTEILEADLKEAQDYYDALRSYAAQFSTDMTDELNAALQNVDSLEDALKIAEAKIAVEDLQKELRNGLYGGVKSAVGNVDSVVSAFERVGEVMSDVDASGWERIMAVWEAMSSMGDALLETIEMIERLASVKEMLAKAQDAQSKAEQTGAQIKSATTAQSMAEDAAETQSIVTNAATTVAAKQGEAAASAAAGTAKLGPLGWLGIGAAIASVLAAFAAIPKFANGGIVGGNSPTGDKILARLNSKEMVLNTTQQDTIYGLLNSRGNVQVSGEFRIRGRDLMAAIDKNNKFRERTK